MKLEGKSAIITGGGTGIGKATALLFAREGADVLITGRREEKLREVADEHNSGGGAIEILSADVTSDADCKKTVDTAIEKFGKVDVLFNNAGILFPGATHETSDEVWDKTFDINVKGTFRMSRAVLPHMLENGYGSIINNSSVVGLKAYPGLVAYVASKGAVSQFTRAMALEYADKGIRVNMINPGVIVTPMVTENYMDHAEDKDQVEQYMKSLHPMGRLGESDEVAHAVLFLAEDNVGFITGSAISVDGGWVAK